MEKHQLNQSTSINTKAIIFGMVLLFIVLQIGFHPTYIQYFPAFKQFTWLHHVHGALMASWVILLLLQPILIHREKLAAHRFIGKLSYITAPLMIISMFLVLRLTYQKHILVTSVREEMATQASIIMQLVSFIILYTLAIVYRKHTFYHMRFMIGTALLMITPTLGRVFYAYFAAEIMYEMYLSIAIAAFLLISDISKKQDWKPYAIVTGTLSFFVFVYHCRYSDAWQAVGKFIANTFY